MAARLPFKIEICVENTDGLIAAQNAGADRAELCASLMEGGLTPSQGMIECALRIATIPFHVIVRPRGGDFLYSAIELEAMRADVRHLRQLGVAGVVIGCLTPDGAIDEARMKTLVEDAGPLAVTCHRAFDMAADPIEAIEALVRAGVHRVLTSGQRETAEEGIPTLKRIMAAAAGRIGIMACGELNAANIARVRQAVDPDEMHFAAPRKEPSAMTFRNTRIGMGGTDFDREYTNTVTDEALVRAMIRAARGG
ncbi:MAG: copper homeostasis protein CutC [Geminicoccaceae bacterium]